MALEEGVENAFDFPGFVPAYIRPLFCEGIGPFRWAALSGPANADINRCPLGGHVQNRTRNPGWIVSWIGLLNRL